MLQQPLTLLDQSQIVTNTFGRRLPGSRLIHFASLTINESMNTTGTVSIHDQFVILTTALNVELIVAAAVAVAGLEVVQQGITEHQRPLPNIQFDGVAGILLGDVISEGGGHRLLAYEGIIGHPRALSARPVPLPQLAEEVQPIESFQFVSPLDVF